MAPLVESNPVSRPEIAGGTRSGSIGDASMIEEATESITQADAELEISSAFPSSILRHARRNIGADLDLLIVLLPSGAAREFVRGLPRRTGPGELLASLEALVRLLQVEEGRR